MHTELKYPHILVWFKQNGVETTLTMHNSTIANAWQRAEAFGWKKPTWYTPWRYLVVYGIVVHGQPITNQTAQYMEFAD